MSIEATVILCIISFIIGFSTCIAIFTIASTSYKIRDKTDGKNEENKYSKN